MREKTMKKLFDNIFWYVLYLLPILYALLVVFRTGSIPTFTDVMAGMGLYDSNPIYSALMSLFGDSTGNGSIMPLFAYANNAILTYVSYFVSVYLIHIAVDVLLFIPRLAHHWMECFNSSLGGGK